jgi:hypothetical protein
LCINKELAMTRFHTPDALLTAVVLSLAAWVVLAVMVLTSLAPLDALVNRSPAARPRPVAEVCVAPGLD